VLTSDESRVSPSADTPGPVSRLRAAYARFVEPTESGLPRLRVLFALPALLLILGVLLVSLSINGSSSGAFYQYIESAAVDPDPDLISGEPQMIRTDEWYVQTSWAIAQVQQGLPETNESFPGGMDTTVPQDLPRADWSVAFRPHLLGFNFLDVDHAMAWKWWMTGLSLIAAVYCFAVTLVPRRPILASALAIGFFYSPLFQWWYLATTFWPVVWGLVVMTAIVWSFKSPSRLSRWLWAVPIAYLTVVMAMGVYVPYIVPVALAVAAFAIGAAATALRGRLGWRSTIARFIPLLTAGVVGSAITVIWLVTRLETVEAFLTTTYPGTRLTPAGDSNAVDLVSLIAVSFTQALDNGGLLRQNSSEAATVFLVGAFLIPVVAWVAIRQRRLRAPQQWSMIGLAAIILVFVAFLFLPGWDPVAHLLFLDRSTENRLRIGMAVASLGIVVLLVRYFDQTGTRAGLKLSGVLAVLYLLSQGGIAAALAYGAPESFASSNLWWLFALLGAATIFFFARSRPALAGAAFLVLAVLGSSGVNPVYRGVYDLRETEVGKAVIELDEANGENWVGVGDRIVSAVLLQTGTQGYNGFQGAPSDTMWDEIDPSGQYEFAWNRLAGIFWVPGEGDPVVSNPVADQIQITFDACDEFAQENVGFVLSDQPLPASDCLVEEEEIEISSGQFIIYEVTPATP
jgi:hypothetical protein